MDTPGFGVAIDNSDCWESVLSFVESQVMLWHKLAPAGWTKRALVSRFLRLFTVRNQTEAGIYKRKSLRKKNENALSTKKKRKKTHFRPRKKGSKQDLDQEKKKENLFLIQKKEGKREFGEEKRASLKILLFFFYKFPPQRRIDDLIWSLGGITAQEVGNSNNFAN